MGKEIARKPRWIKFSIPGGKEYTRLKGIISAQKLHTVCTEARCPNIGECFSCGTATFLIMGPVCTRNCRYCSVASGVPAELDHDEPFRVAAAVRDMNLTYAVITSVTRDDLADGGASCFAATVENIRSLVPSCSVELLIPDFKGSMEPSLARIIDARPDVINHNIEVVKSHYRELRPRGDYGLSLRLLKSASASGIPAKSGLMIGFGETIEEIFGTIDDLADAGCSIITVGQYLQSKVDGYPTVKYYTPDEFIRIEHYAREKGVSRVLSGPLVRSSYHASLLSN
ncbi:MAG TPA: lipoyl synthase [Spirochaetota bacterium]|nr:lipoyl synthase [Spirochaetota bacterium]HPI90996.1 lipoyl synthase [Spirochaetota bacterium]HPR46809.1 lipoyl synthase [Spirochaetota bacterium]